MQSGEGRHRACGRQWRSLLIGFIAAASCFGSASRSLAEEARFEGAYVFAGGQGERRSFEQAIESVVTEMNVMIRSIARSRMRPRIFIAHQIRFHTMSDRVRIEHEPLPPRIVRIGGSPNRLTNRAGDDVEVRYRWQNDTLVEVIAQGRSSRTNHYRFVDGGARCLLTTRIQAAQLPSDIRFSLSYRRL